MQFINQIVDVLNWCATNIPWDAVLASGVLSGVLVGPQKLVKKWFEHNEQIIIVIIGVAGVTVTTVWSYLIHNYPTSPQIVALQGLALAFATQPFYFIVVKPLSKRIAAWFAIQVAKAAALNDAKSAEVPVTPSLPVVNDN